MTRRSINNMALWIFILLALNTGISPGQGEKISFKQLSIEDGLSQSSVYAILQDKKGFMWFGTEAGLNRFDGYKFVHYLYKANDPNSLSHNWILAVCVDHTGSFWIGTEDGLNRFDRKKEKFIKYIHQANDSHSLSNNRILAIHEDSHERLWIGTENGLNQFDRENDQFIRYQANDHNLPGLSHNTVNCISEGDKGLLWIGTNNGLNRFDPSNNTFVHFKNQPENPNSLSDSHVLSTYLDGKGILWIGTEKGGLNRFDPSTNLFKQYKKNPDNPNSLSDNHVNVIFQDQSGVFWIGTNEGGLNRFDSQKEIFNQFRNDPDDPNSLGSNRILSIFEDQAGGLWFGNYAGGINIFNRTARKFIHYRTEPNNPNSLSYNDVRQVYEDHQGLIWIGTDGGGLNRLNRKTGLFTHFNKDPQDTKSISDNRIFAICQDLDHHLWIGTYGGGLNKFDRNKEAFTSWQSDPQNPFSLSDNRIRSIIADHSGQLWLGTDGGGVNKFDPRIEKFSHFQHDPNDPSSLSKNRIFFVYEDHQHMIWIGTFGGGLDRLNPQTLTFSHFRNDENDPQSISNNYILSMVETHAKELWVGTDGGINKFDPSRTKFKRYTVKDGLPNNVIYDILEDKSGNLWIPTNSGLSKFNPVTETFKNYDMKDGLQSNEFNTGTGFKSKSGEMFFGGVNGFNSFYPEKIIDNPHVPRIVITDFQLFNESVPIGPTQGGRTILTESIIETQNIDLHYSDKVFSFEFAALHFASPDKNRYAYMMQGFEKKWNYVNNRRFATYTGLPPGEYIFKVKGSNNDGLWNEEGMSLKISIKPPFWRTTWFYLSCATLLLLLTFAIYRIRVKQLKIREEELADLVKERTSQLALSNRQLENLNKELEKLSVVVRETDNAVLITDTEGKFIWINEGFTRMYDVNLEQLINERGKNIIDSSTNPQIKEIIQTCIRKNQTVNYESSYVKRNGQKIWTQTSLTPIFDADKKLTNLVAIDSDITKIKEAEEAAERANQSKSEFLARMSHEIRTPMNGIIGFSEMLLDTVLSDEQIDYARTISKSGEALISILNDILDFSKIEAGELTFDLIDFDPEITIFDICDLILPRIGTKPIELLCRIGDQVPAYVRSDAGRFRQVIVNLLGNAAKFTERGEIEVSLDVEEEKADQLKLLVKIRDTGIGIPQNKVDHIFEVFQQADGSTTRKYGGTGLGLSICKQISKLQGGDVTAESEYGKGSTFYYSCWVEKSKKRRNWNLKNHSC